MAEFILKHPYPNPPGWAQFDKGAIKWVRSASEATPFPSETEAREAFKTARAAMLDKGKAKLERDLAAGKRIKQRYGPSDRPPTLEDCAAQWVLNNRFSPITESRATSDDLLGVLELWFVKNPQGWLREGKDRDMVFEQNFHGAMPFLSLEAAKGGLRRAYDRGSCSFIRGSMAFSQVISDSPSGRLDEQARAIASACEAREIGAEIQAAATARLSDMKNATPKPKARL